MDYIFGSKKDKVFCAAFVFRRGMSNAIYDLVLRLLNEGLNISWICHGGIPFQYLKTVFAMQYSPLSLAGSQFAFLKCDGSIWDLGGKFRQNEFVCFEIFEVWVLHFSLKGHIMRNIYNQIVAELAHCVIVIIRRN